ncbi:MAG: alpha/beta hydrolase [Ignavibacteriaceae bacterium]
MKKYFFLIIILSVIAGCNNRKNNELKSGEIKTSDANIYYIEKGNGDTTLLFLHGWGINSGYWNNQINYFSIKYRTVAVDLPGFGESTSTRENYPVEKYGDDVIDVINKLDLKNVILVGHSMSGDIILEAALKNNKQIAGVVGIDNFKFVGIEMSPAQLNEMNSFVDSLKKDYKNLAPEYASKYLFSSSTDSIVRERVKNDYGNSNPDVAVSSIKNVFDYNEMKKLQGLNYKLYLINSDGMATNTDGLKKYCKSSYEVLDIHGTGHFPMIEKPDEFNRLLQTAVYKIHNSGN